MSTFESEVAKLYRLHPSKRRAQRAKVKSLARELIWRGISDKGGRLSSFSSAEIDKTVAALIRETKKDLGV